MTTQTIFVGKLDVPGSDNPSYAIVHRFSPHEATAHYCSGLSRDHVVGYLEGATAGRWNAIEINNGIPDEYIDALHPYTPRRLAKRDLSGLLRSAGIAEQFVGRAAQ